MNSILLRAIDSAATRKHTMMGQKYFKGGEVKINNNSENFRGARLLPEEI